MVIKIKEMQIKERDHRHISSCDDKGDLKGFQTNFKALSLRVSVTIWHDTCQLVSAGVKKKAHVHSWKNNVSSLARTVTTIFSAQIVNDPTESIIHSYRRLIDVKSLTSVQLVKGKESNCELFQFFNFKVVRICSFVCCNGMCKSGLSSTKTKFKWDISTRHKGILCGSFLIEFLQFPLCSLLYKCPNWTDMERLTESVYLL